MLPLATVAIAVLHFIYVQSPEYFQGLWGDRNTANFDDVQCNV
jgi:hypothetical protein